jgi:FKBP12-rapamycin complex-associated protein
VLRFAGYLRQILGQQTDAVVVVPASKALGNLARTGGTMTADFVEMEAKRALERLQENRLVLLLTSKYQKRPNF